MFRNRLRLLQVNDSHGYLEPHPELFWQGKDVHHQMVGGYARLKTAMKQLTDSFNGPVLSFDCGDTFHGTYPVVKSKGEAIIPLLNEMGFQAMTAHWEFAYGPRHFKKISEKLNYPVLALNCYHENRDKLFFKPYTLIEQDDLQVGVIGIAANSVDKVMPPHFSENIYFTLGDKELPPIIELLRREGVDLIIVLSHLGFPQDVKLAQEVEGIDVILSGHTHNRLEKPFLVGNTLIIQSGCHASFLGCLDLELEAGKVKYNHQLLVLDNKIPPDNTMQEMVDQVMEPHREFLEQRIGFTKTELNRNTIMESTMDNLLLQSIMDVLKVDLAFSNGWRYGAPLPPGPIRMEDLWNIIPTNPHLSTVELSGREIWNMLEENVERTFSSDPYKQMGGYLKRCGGMNLYLKIENPLGSRVQEIFIGGKKLEPERKYDAGFITTQGVPANYGTNRQDRGLKAVDVLTNYINKKKKVSAELMGSMVAV